MAEKPPSSLARYSIVYLLAIMLGLALFQYYSVAERTFEITYSEFRHLVENKGVNDLVLSTEGVKGRLLPNGIEELAKERKEPDLPKKLEKQFDKKEPSFTTVRLEDAGLIDLLGTANLQHQAVQEKTWLTGLLSWVLPMLLLVGIWVYFFRKTGPGGGGLVTGGKYTA